MRGTSCLHCHAEGKGLCMTGWYAARHSLLVVCSLASSSKSSLCPALVVAQLAAAAATGELRHSPVAAFCYCWHVLFPGEAPAGHVPQPYRAL